MVNPLDFVPKLSGFSPMPLGIMAPFMGYQSAALAYNFGLNYEFGKRVIKSMSNERFNKLAEDPILLNELTSRHHDVLLTAFIHEVPKVDKIQDLIIKKMVELEFAKIKVMPELIAQIPKGFLEGIFSLGKGEGDDFQEEQKHEHTKDHHKETEDKGKKKKDKIIIKGSAEYVKIHAVGIVYHDNKKKLWRFEAKQIGQWVLIKKHHSSTTPIAWAIASYPAVEGYIIKQFGSVRYWIHNSKL